MWKIIEMQKNLEMLKKLDSELYQAKRIGFSDNQIGKMIGKDENWVRDLRQEYSIKPQLNSLIQLLLNIHALQTYI